MVQNHVSEFTYNGQPIAEQAVADAQRNADGSEYLTSLVSSDGADRAAAAENILFGYSHLTISGGSFDPGDPLHVSYQNGIPYPDPILPTIIPPSLEFAPSSRQNHVSIATDSYIEGETKEILRHLVREGTFQQTILNAPTQGSNNDFQVATFIDDRVGLNTDPSRYTAIIHWGDGTPSDVGTVTYDTHRSDSTHRYFDVRGDHFYALPAGTGLPLSVDISTADGAEASLAFGVPLEVALQPLRPQFRNPATNSVTVGDTFSADLSAIDPITGNPLGSFSDYIFGIDSRVEGPYPTGDFSWTPQESDVGTHTVTVIVEDYRGGFVPTVTSMQFQVYVYSGLPHLTSLSPSDQPSPTTLGVHNLGSDRLTLTANGLTSPGTGTTAVYFYRDDGHDGQPDFYLGAADTISGSTATWSHQVGGKLPIGATVTFFAQAVRYLPGDTYHTNPLRGNLVKTTVKTVAGVDPPPVAFPIVGTDTQGNPIYQTLLLAPSGLDNGYLGADTPDTRRVIWSTSDMPGYSIFTKQFYDYGAQASILKLLLQIPFGERYTAAMDTRGYFALAWTSGSNLNIQWYAPDQSLFGSQIRIWTGTHASGLAMATDNHGSLLIAYQAGAAGTEDIYEVATQQYNNQIAYHVGAPTSSSIYAVPRSQYNSLTQLPPTPGPINSNTNRAQIEPTVALNSNGDGVIAWRDSDLNEIVARRVGSAGQVLFAENVRVSDSGSVPTGGGLASAINSAGVYLLAWTHNGSSTSGIYARLYEFHAHPLGLGLPFLANQFTGGFHRIPVAALNDFGMSVIGYSLTGANTGSHSVGAYAQVFDPSGKPLGPEFAVANVMGGDQELRGLVITRQNQLTAGWGDFTTNPPRIYMRRFNINIPPQFTGSTVMTVAGTAPAGTVVGTAQAIDADGDPLSYSLADNTSPFAIDANSGRITVQNVAALGSAHQSQYLLKVQLTDSGVSGTQPMSASETVTINVTFPPPPTSKVNPLPASSSEAFAVSWTGSDPAAAIVSYDVFVSADGGPFTRWLTGVPYTTALFQGVLNHQYSFYSVATDQFGTPQQSGLGAQAATFVSITPTFKINADSPAGTVVGSLRVANTGSEQLSYNFGTSPFAINWQTGQITVWNASALSSAQLLPPSFQFSILIIDINNHSLAAVEHFAINVVIPPPTSSVSALPANSAEAFNVTWSGSDVAAGGGIASYDIFVSIDGGTFSRWLTGTATTTALYHAVLNHQYAFYSVATDHLGNRQGTPSSAQASTTVNIAAPSASHNVVQAGDTSLTVTFNTPVVGADQASAFHLQSAGPDGWLGTFDDTIIPLTDNYSGTTATLSFAALPAGLYRLTINSSITDLAGNALPAYSSDFVLTGGAVVNLTSPGGFTFDTQGSGFGAGQLVQGSSNAFNGLNRLQVDDADYSPAGAASVTNSGQTLVTAAQTLDGLDFHREITVPTTGSQDFARTVEVLQNPSDTAITTSVQIVGNLGSDAATHVFATSSGRKTVDVNDEWIGTDGGGTPAVIHFIHGPTGLVPTAVNLVGDNIVWTYVVTIQPGDTLKLAEFTIVNNSEAGAIAAANTLVTRTGFGGQAAAFLSPDDLAALANFQFDDTTPPVISLPVNLLAANDPGGIYGNIPSIFQTRTKASLVEEAGKSMDNVVAIYVLDLHAFDGPSGTYIVNPPAGSPYAYELLNQDDGAGNHILLGVVERTAANDPLANYDSRTKASLVAEVGKPLDNVVAIDVLDLHAYDGPGGTQVLPAPQGSPYSYELLNQNDDASYHVLLGVMEVPPPHITVTGTGPGGAIVSYTMPTAIDDVDGAVTVNSDHPSGTLFSLGTTTIHFTATDAHGNTAHHSMDVTVLPQPPAAVNDSANALRETPTVLNVLGNDSDPNNFPFTLQSVTTPGHGSTAINSDGTITYTPAVNFLGTDSFQYTIANVAGLTSTATVTVTVNFTSQTRHWTGGGGNDNHWSNAANWELAPLAGDTLVFDGTQSTAETTQNDFPAGTAFASLVLQDMGQQKWILVGNSVALAGADAIVGATQPANGSYIENKVSLPIILTADASFHGLGTSVLTVDSINTNGHTLTLGSVANANFLDTIAIGDVSGTGALFSVASSQLEVNVFGTVNLSGPAAVNCQWFVEGSLGCSEVDVSSTGNVQGRGNANSPLILNAGAKITGGNVGQLRVGSLSLNFGSLFTMSAFGPADGAFDQLIVHGTVNLNNAELSSYVFAPTVGDQYKIIDNQGSHAVSGNFVGLPEGATFFTGNGYPMQISYAGGDGNDVVLTAVAPLFYDAASNPTFTAYTLRLSGANLQLVDSNNPSTVLTSEPLAYCTQVDISGQAGGSDTLTIDYSGAYFTVPGGINFNGGGFGTLNVSGGGFASITDNATGPGAGGLDLHPATGLDSTIAYIGLVPINVTSSATDVTVNLPASVQDALLADSGTDHMETIGSVSGALASFTFADPTGTLTINGTSGDAETLTVQALNPSFNANLGVDLKGNSSGSGTDQVVFDDSHGTAVRTGGNVGVTADSIVAANASNTSAEIAATGTVTLNASGPVGSSANRIQFSATNAPSSIIVGSTVQPSGVYLDGLGSLTLGNIATQNGSLDVTAHNALTVAASARIDTGTGTIALAADANADGTGNANTGKLTIEAGAVVDSANTSSSAITLRGADIDIATGSDPAMVGAHLAPAPYLANTLYGLYDIYGFAGDSQGNRYVAESLPNRVAVFAPGSTSPTSFLSGVSLPTGLAVNQAGDLFVASAFTGQAAKFAAGSTTGTPLTGTSQPEAVMVDSQGNLFIGNFGCGLLLPMARRLRALKQRTRDAGILASRACQKLNPLPICRENLISRNSPRTREDTQDTRTGDMLAWSSRDKCYVLYQKRKEELPSLGRRRRWDIDSRRSPG